jgi:methyl-accepting chemotaxis protein
MSWKNFRIGSKLAIAFGTVIIFSIAVGIYALINMMQMGDRSSDMSTQFIPMTSLSNQITSSAQSAVLAQQNYTFYLDSKYLEESKRHLDSLRYYLGLAKQLASQNGSLKQFSSVIDASESSLNNYTSGITDIQAKAEKASSNKIKAGQLKTDFEVIGNQYIALQKRILAYELKNTSKSFAIYTRIDNITLYNSFSNKAIEGFNMIINSGVSNSQNDLIAAVTKFEESEQMLNKLLTISRGEDLKVVHSAQDQVLVGKTICTENIQAINDLNAAATNSKDLTAKLIEDFKLVSAVSSQFTKDNAIETTRRVRNTSGVLLIGIIVSIFISVLFAFFITRSVSRSIKKGVAFARQVASGDLDATFELNQKDEIGQLAEALKDMLLKLRKVISEVLEGANTIADASIHISQNAQNMANGANQQASAAQQVSSSMEQMVANIQQNTDNSKQTEQISIKAAEGIKSGAQITITASESMQKIADKISIINDIAFQTNILALNAAVEAARAGEHGRGFAVVAAEVRKLAENSKSAAEEIDQLSKAGVNISESAGKQLEAIVPEIERTSKLVQEIASASREQNAGAEQINSAIQQLNMVTQSNAVISDSVATNAEKLSIQAEKLMNIINYFKITLNTKKAIDQPKQAFKGIEKKIEKKFEKRPEDQKHVTSSTIDKKSISNKTTEHKPSTITKPALTKPATNGHKVASIEKNEPVKVPVVPKPIQKIGQKPGVKINLGKPIKEELYEKF